MADFPIDRRRFLCAAAALPLASGLGAVSADTTSGADHVSVLDPSGSLDDWQERNGSDAVSWKVSGEGSEAVVEVRTTGAFAVYTRDLDAQITDRSRLEWRWRVDEMPDRADLNSLKTDDLGAGVALVFGKAGLLRKMPPMLIYTWSGSANADDGIVTCGRHPDAMRFVIVRSGLDASGQWQNERRDVARDFEEAFGTAPPGRVHAAALWSDSDQTGASTRAAFGPITLYHGLSRV